MLATYRLKRRDLAELVFSFTLCMYAHYFFFILVPVVGPTALRSELFAGQNGFIASLVYALVERGDTAGGAFPSSHCAGALLLTWYAGRIFGSKLVWLLAPLTALIVLSSVYLSMHYAIDSIAGLITGAVFAYSGPRLYDRVSKWVAG
jgi:membrane-associated phospholipid phosphatase